MLDLAEFFEIQNRLFLYTPLKYKRFLYDRVDWDSRLAGLYGARGTGKTTLLLQHLKTISHPQGEILYLSADHIRVVSRAPLPL